MKHFTMVKPGAQVDLSAVDPDFHEELHKDDSRVKARSDAAREAMRGLQERLYAEGKQSLLVVLQAMDTGGKDGTIRHVFRGLNPAGCRVASFKQPTPEELAHDFLWRIHCETPRRGEIVIFNRSHYEDVLVVRVHGLAPEEVWRGRYEQIRDFEALLAANGTRIVKLFLYISRDEQKQRLQKRLDNPEKHWKFSAGDLKERECWDDYIAAYEEALSRCSTEAAPWCIIPANHKWYRSMIVSEIIAAALAEMAPRFPEVDFDSSEITIE